MATILALALDADLAATYPIALAARKSLIIEQAQYLAIVAEKNR